MINLDELKDKIENNGKIVLRPSSLQQFINCPAQWFRASLMQDFQIPKAAAEAGSALHRGAEVGYTEKIASGNNPKLDTITDAIRDDWEARNSEYEIIFQDGETKDSIQADLITDAKTYYPVMLETSPVAVETRYTLEIDHPIFSAVSGTIDIDLDGGLADIKRTNKKVTPSMLPKYMLQQSIYAFLKRTSGKSCMKAEIHNVAKGIGSNVLDLELNINYARSVVNSILETTASFWETGNTNLFRGCNPMSNFLCSSKWCGYWEQCPYVKDLRS